MKHLIWIALVVALAVGLLAFKPWDTDKGNSSALPEFTAVRGDMVIDVLEGGNIQALESLEIKCEIKGSVGAKVIDIIDEGYEVTEEDVKAKKVLVTLDPSTIEDAIVDHDVTFQQTEATYAEALQNLEIEESEALSELKGVRQLLRFALLDFEKFVGSDTAKEILISMNLPYDQATLEAYEDRATRLIVASYDRDKLQNSASKENIEEKPFTGDGTASKASEIKFSNFLKSNKLGAGEAEQTVRRMMDEALLAESELAVVSESVEGAKRLRAREFITKQTFENELVNLDKAKLSVKTKKTELDLFRDYEFPKEAEKMLSNYEEELLELIREKREKMAKMSQVYAKYRSYKRRYELELEKRKDLDEQLLSCVIYAEKPGLVAYGGANQNYYTSRYYEAITTGATLKFGQPIITIPDMSKMGVDVSIHESHIKKIKLDQEVRVTVESVPDEVLIGRISKVAVLPDSNASRYNPTLKVYPATIEISGTHEFLKPGMTAKTEIIVKKLEDITYIPVQAVFVEDDKHFVFIRKGSGYARQDVEIGDHNDEFIEIHQGVEPGQDVALIMPEDYEPESGDS